MDPSEKTNPPDDQKILSFQSDYEGEFKVIDSNGNKLAEGFERPMTTCYVNAHIPGPEKGQIIDGFGAETENLEMARSRVKDFFEKHGFSFHE